MLERGPERAREPRNNQDDASHEQAPQGGGILGFFDNIFTRLRNEDPKTFRRFIERLPKPTTEGDIEAVKRITRKVLDKLGPKL